MGISRSSARASKKLCEVLEAYECHDHQHAIAILTVDYPHLLLEIFDVLLAFRIGIDFIKKAGGNESDIPKALSRQLRPLGWKEQKLDIELKAGGQTRTTDTHKIDYVKGKVAFDLEWNSKDQTFGREFYAFRSLLQRSVSAKVILIQVKPEIQRMHREVVMFDNKSIWQNLVCPALILWPTRRVWTRANDRYLPI
jgi:CRISPR-associated protein Csd2